MTLVQTFSPAEISWWIPAALQLHIITAAAKRRSFCASCWFMVVFVCKLVSDFNVLKSFCNVEKFIKRIEIFACADIIDHRQSFHIY